MTQLSNSMKALITPEMMNRASALLGEKQANVSNAVSTIIPSLLGILLKKEHSPQIKNILEEAGELNIASNIKPIFEGKPGINQQNVGDNFLQHLLGNRAADFTAPIAGHANISKVAANRLISMVAPVVAGYLGNRVVKEKLTMPQLVEEIGGEKIDFEGLIPIDLIKAFDLYPKLKTNNAAESNKTEAASAANNQAKITSTTNDQTNKPEETKKGNGWIMLIILLILFLILFLWWRSCRGERNETSTQQETTTEIGTERATTELTLPNGTQLNAYPGGLEERMIRFLESDEYRTATNETLKNRWFEFDNVNFVDGSPTELKSDSKVQLDNIIAILKNFKDAKIEIGVFADIAENERDDLARSFDRVTTIESLLEQGGIGSQLVKILASTKEFITRNAESNMNQEIALRFVK